MDTVDPSPGEPRPGRAPSLWVSAFALHQERLEGRFYRARLLAADRLAALRPREHHQVDLRV